MDSNLVKYTQILYLDRILRHYIVLFISSAISYLH